MRMAPKGEYTILVNELHATVGEDPGCGDRKPHPGMCTDRRPHFPATLYPEDAA